MSYEQILAGSSAADADTGEDLARKINANFERVYEALDTKATANKEGKVSAALQADLFACPVSISLEGEILSNTGTIDGSKNITLATVVSQVPVEKITGLMDDTGKIDVSLLPQPQGAADISNKADKVADATENNVAVFTADGNIQDSGVNLINKANLIDGKIPVSQIPPLSADVVAETTDRKYVSEQQISKWDNKADLADGKVPSSQLPDPAVGSVFGRAGAVTAQDGDYSADKITETEGRVFVSPAQRAALEAGGWGRLVSSKPAVADLNAVPLSGLYYYGGGAAGSPHADRPGVLCAQMSDARWGMQEAWDTLGASYQRFLRDGVWSTWRRVCTDDFSLGKTGYVYPCLPKYRDPMEGANTIDGITKEYHGFTFNVPGTPLSDNRYGFLDAGYYDGRSFVPGPITYQRFIDYNDGQPYYRVHAGGAWKAWRKVCTDGNTGNVVNLTLLNGWKLQWDGHAAAYRVGKMILFNVGPIAGGTVAEQGQICNLAGALGAASAYDSTYCVAVDWTGRLPASARVRNGVLVQDIGGGKMPWTAGHMYTIVGMCPIQ